MASNKFRRGRLNSFSISFSDDILPHLAQTANIMMELEGETKKRKFNGGEFSLTAVDNDTVEIRFGKTDNQKKYRLFEVSKQLLAEVVGAGCRLVGDNTVDVVLCTSSKTYSIKKVEISNSVYLVPPSLDPNIFCVQNPHREYYEVSPTLPRLDQLKQLLTLSAYSGRDNEENPVVKSNLITRVSLPQLIQASDDEINSALNSLNTIEINGYLRLVDSAALHEMSSHLLDTIMENRWDIGQVTLQMCIASMDSSVDKYLLQSALNSLSSSKSPVSEEVWQLDYGLVSKTIAKKLFRTRLSTQRERIWPAEDFLLTWSINVPSSANKHPPIDCLSGIAIREVEVKRGKNIECFFFLDVDELSSNVKTRFQELFQFRPRYTHQEIDPYLKEFYGHTNQPKTIHELLLQYTLLIDGFYHIKPE